MTERFVAIAQVLISVTFIAGYFWVLHRFMSGDVLIPQGYNEAFLTILGVLTAGVTGILAFWFARTRQSSAQSA